MAYIIPDDKADTRGHVTSDLYAVMDKVKHAARLLSTDLPSDSDTDAADEVAGLNIALREIREAQTLLESVVYDIS